jgi:hypothetical protein
MTNQERALQLLEDSRESLTRVAHVTLEHPETPSQAAVQDLLRIALDAIRAAKRQIEFDSLPK